MELAHQFRRRTSIDCIGTVHRWLPARVRPIEGIGIELRYERNGELRASQMFSAWELLEAAATEKRQEIEARGWHAEPQPGG